MPPFCACPKAGPEFPTPYCGFFYVLIDLRCEVIVHFVDVGGFADRHCLSSSIFHIILNIVIIDKIKYLVFNL
jgi:hypothetical protein